MSRPIYAPKETYIGTGSLSSYTFDFKIEELTQLEIIELDDTGAETQRVRGDDTVYLSSVDFDNLDGAGTVNLTAVLPAGYTLLILQANDAPTQPYEFKNKGQFTLERFELALDFVAGAINRLTYKASQAFRVHDADDVDAFSTRLPIAIADQAERPLIINTDGDGLDYGPTQAETIEIANAHSDAQDVIQSAALEVIMDEKDDAQTLDLETLMDTKDAAQSVILEASMTAKDDAVRTDYAAADLVIQNAVDAIEVKTDNITVTQPVNLDEMEAAIAGGGSGTISEWTTGILYAVDAIIWETDDFYRCNTSHTSGATFAGDAANWDQMSDKLTGAEIKALYEVEANAYTDAKDTAITDHIAATAAHGVTGNIVGTTDAQALTNKTISLSKIITKSDTLANLTTYATTATNGELLYSTDTKEYYGIEDGVLTALGGGSGGGIAEWVTATDYEVGNVIWEGSEIYVCNVDHTSGATFIGDVAKWDELSPQLTATEIETLYEGLADTNKYTDAEKAKVGFVTVTGAVNLDTIDTNVGSLLDINQDRGEPTGFIRDLPDTTGILELSPDGIIIHRINELGVFSTSVATHPAYDAGITAGQFYDGTLANARELRLSPKTGTDLEVYIKGIKFVKATGETVVLADVTGIQFIYFSDLGVLSATTVFDYDFLSVKPIVSLVYGNSTTQELVTFADERHGIVMDGFTHRYHHFTEGAHYSGGMDIAGLVDGVNTHGTMSEGYLYDEDLYDVIPEQTTMPFWYIDGTEWRIVQDGNELGIINGADTYISYNENVAGNFQLTEITGVLNTTIMFILATNDKVTPYVKVLGQNLYGSATAARDAIGTELASLVTEGLPTPEFVFTAAYIIRRTGNLEALDDGSTHVDLRTIKVNAQGAQSTAIVDHRKTTHREDEDQHPIKSITDLKNRITTHDYALLEGASTPITDWDTTGILGASFTLDADEAYIWAVDNDNGAEVTIDFPLSWEHRNGDMHKLTAPFILTGTDDVIELELWDKTNSVLISTIIPSGDDALIHSYMPLETCEEITYKLKAITAGVASLKIDKMVFSDKFYESGSSVISETITATGYLSGGGSYLTLGATSRVDTSDVLVERTDVTETRYTFLKTSSFVATAGIYTADSGAKELEIRLFNSLGVQIRTNRVTTTYHKSVSMSDIANIGDYIILYSLATPSNSEITNFSVTANASSATHQFEDSFEQGHILASFKLEGNGGESITANTQNIPFAGTGEFWTSGAGLTDNYYTIQKDGTILDIKTATFWSGSVIREVGLYRNNAFYKRIGDFLSTSNPHGNYKSEVGEFTKDDKISFRVTSASASLSNDSIYHYLNITEEYLPPSTESSSVRSLVVSSVLENDFDVDASSAGVLSNFNGADDWCSFVSSAAPDANYALNEDIFTSGVFPNIKSTVHAGGATIGVILGVFPAFTIRMRDHTGGAQLYDHTISAKKRGADRSDRTAAMVNGKDVVKANHKTTEFDTGEEWVDGRTIYGRSFSFTQSIAADTFTVLDVIDSGLELISIEASVLTSSGKYYSASTAATATISACGYEVVTGEIEFKNGLATVAQIVEIRYVK